MSLDKFPIGINLSDRLKILEIIGRQQLKRPPPLGMLWPALHEFKDDVIAPIFVPAFCVDKTDPEIVKYTFSLILGAVPIYALYPSEFD